MKTKFIINIISFLLCSSAMADISNNDSMFYGGVYGGYGAIRGAYSQDGDFAQGRAALGVRVFNATFVHLGFEAGIQSGSTMRLNSTAQMVTNGLLPPQATLKPMLDLLFTVQGKFSQEKPLSYFLKAGGAYRELILNNYTSSNDSVRKINPEFQAGLGYDLSKQITVVAYYQGIYGGSNVNLQLDSSSNVMISRIPTQQAGFLGVEYHF